MVGQGSVSNGCVHITRDADWGSLRMKKGFFAIDWNLSRKGTKRERASQQGQPQHARQQISAQRETFKRSDRINLESPKQYGD